MSARKRAVRTDARYIPFTVPTTPSQCQQRASAPASRPCSCRENAGTRARGTRTPHRPGAPGQAPGQPPGYAHKDPDLRNTRRTQGRNQALVCGAVLSNSLPCVRHRGMDAENGQEQGQAHPLTADPRRKGLLDSSGAQGNREPEQRPCQAASTARPRRLGRLRTGTAPLGLAPTPGPPHDNGLTSRTG